jgi:hypothetical protein
MRTHRPLMHTWFDRWLLRWACQSELHWQRQPLRARHY